MSGAHSAALRIADCDCVTMLPSLVHPGQGIVALGRAHVDQHTLGLAVVPGRGRVVE